MQLVEHYTGVGSQRVECSVGFFTGIAKDGAVIDGIGRDSRDHQ
jgi:hypothetical protein